MNAMQRLTGAELTLPAQLRGELRYDEPLAKHTSWRVGGPADLFFKPASKADLALFLASLPPNLPVFWLGLGSNVLIRDGGIRGAVIATHGALSDLRRLSDTAVWCDAGVPCAKLAKQCAKWQLGPAEFFAGIPGTLGGALAMNAGAFGGETWSHVVAVETIDRRGQVQQRLAAEYAVAYRQVRAAAHHGPEWFLGAQLHFQISDVSGEAQIRALLAQRKQSQPIGEPSCGSTFTNPPGHHAAKLIDRAGLKGLRCGGAMVSMKHANFIINVGAATAHDIETLIHKISDIVRDQYGVTLTPEVRIVGEPLLENA